MTSGSTRPVPAPLTVVPGIDMPPGVSVIVRDWLNANHVLLAGRDEVVLVDAGHVSCAATTLDLVAAQLAGRSLDRLLLTHCHSDHMGGCAAIRRTFGPSIAVPADEAPLIRAWDSTALWLEHAGQRAERFEFDAVVRAGDRMCMADLEWEALAVPGHDMGALAFWCADEGILISGDALWERSFGVVLPGDGHALRLLAARDTLLRLRSLGARVVIPGHGAPFTDADAAIAACLSRVAAFEQDERRLARHVLKVMFVFLLLERGSLAQDEARGLFATVPLFVDYDDRYFRLGPEVLATSLMEELAAAGAIFRDASGLIQAA